jgi:hypothetical protein
MDFHSFEQIYFEVFFIISISKYKKLSYHQYRTWSVCMDVLAGLTLYQWQWVAKADHFMSVGKGLIWFAKFPENAVHYYDKNQHIGFATSMDPDQPTHPRSLIRIPAVRYQFLYVL